MTDITSTFFDWELRYDGNTFGNQAANYNGNINGTVGRYKFDQANNAPTDFADFCRYHYTYDRMNRLTVANGTLKQNGSSINNQWGDAFYAYDKIGNFTSLRRKERSTGNSVNHVKYYYQYQGNTNRLTQINLNSSSGPIDRSIAYDSNGNLLTDSKRGINGTTYGRANLPWTQAIGINTNNYLYDINDARIFKAAHNITFRAIPVAEFYLRDAAGKELAVYNFNSNQLTWYVFGNERVARIRHHEAFTFEEPQDPTTDPPCNCDPKFNPGCNDRFIRTDDLFDKNKIDLNDESNTRLINLANVLEDCNDTTPPGDNGETTTRAIYNTRVNVVTKADETLDYVREEDMSTLQDGYTINESIFIESGHQLFLMSTTDGRDIPVSIETMLSLNESDSPPEGFTGSGDPFSTPMNEMLDAPVVRATYYIHDHLGNTRVNYYYNCSGDNEGYILESVLNYYPYGKILEEYIPFGPSEKYLTTHHERDLESGLDYRGARMYDSDVGRFLSLDPLADEPQNISWSPFAYVWDNPISNIDPDGRSGVPVIDKVNKTITVYSKFVFYGGSATTQLSKSIANEIAGQYNGANAQVTVGGVQYSVKFKINYETVTEAEAAKMAAGNTDAKVNFIRVEKNNSRLRRSFNEIGENNGFMNTDDGLGTSTTAPHEVGHGYGLVHPPGDQRGKGQPDIMAARGTLVDPQYQYDPNAKAGAKGGTINPKTRRVTQGNITDMFKGVKFDKNGRGQIGKATNRIYNKNGYEKKP
ncbi:MAG: RHS repeat-associated core domain-containing protein [Bacteroidota bacterium]